VKNVQRGDWKTTFGKLYLEDLRRRSGAGAHQRDQQLPWRFLVLAGLSLATLVGVTALSLPAGTFYHWRTPMTLADYIWIITPALTAAVWITIMNLQQISTRGLPRQPALLFFRARPWIFCAGFALELYKNNFSISFANCRYVLSAYYMGSCLALMVSALYGYRGWGAQSLDLLLSTSLYVRHSNLLVPWIFLRYIWVRLYTFQRLRNMSFFLWPLPIIWLINWLFIKGASFFFLCFSLLKSLSSSTDNWLNVLLVTAEAFLPLVYRHGVVALSAMIPATINAIFFALPRWLH
jgi:hypothetical protein